MAQSRLDSRQVEVIDPAMAAVLRRKSPSQRVAMIGAAHRTAKAILRAQIKRKHPDWDAHAVDREVARRLLRGTT